jgi:hypothetical protein
VTVYRPGESGCATPTEIMSASVGSIRAMASGNSFPFASFSDTAVIESSGRSENQSRINCGEFEILDPAAGSLRFK